MKFSRLLCALACAAATVVIPLPVMAQAPDSASGRYARCTDEIKFTPTYGVPPSRRGAQNIRPLKSNGIKRKIVGRIYMFNMENHSKIWKKFNAGGTCEYLVENRGTKKLLDNGCTWEIQGCTLKSRYTNSAGEPVATTATLYEVQQKMKFKITEDATGRARLLDANFISKSIFARLKAEASAQ